MSRNSIHNKKRKYYICKLIKVYISIKYILIEEKNHMQTYPHIKYKRAGAQQACCRQKKIHT